MTDITFVVALEFAILLGYDGQLQLNSDLEMELFTSCIKQMKRTKMTKLQNALTWLYVKSWDHFGQHLLEEESLWKFGGEDLEAALKVFATADETNKSEMTTVLKNLIMERFDNNETNFFEWSRRLHNEVLIKCNIIYITFK